MTSVCCDHAPKSGLLSLEEALDNLLNLPSTSSLSSEIIPLSKAHHRILASDITSSINVPPEDNSAVDGYAINLSDYKTGCIFPISQRVPAGSKPAPLAAQTAARIFTGANIPEGANCVIMQENVILSDNAISLPLDSVFEVKQNIRARGQDIAQDNLVLKKGTVLTPQAIGLIASIGINEISVFKPLKVAILSTGDELVEPGKSLDTGQIYNSNRYLLQSFLNELNIEVVDFGVIADNIEATTNTLTQASQQADVVITTGGASVGEEDYIQSAISQLGELDFWKVAIKPGKPFMLGKINNTPILGLPGNPGAVFVTFMILARPFLLNRQGITGTNLKPYFLPISFNIKKPGNRREFLRVIRNEHNELELHPNQSSGMLSSAQWAEGLAIITEGTAPKKGDHVPFIPFSALLHLPC